MAAKEKAQVEENAQFATVDENKREALLMAMQKIDKDFGKGTIMTLGARAAAEDIPSIPSGSILLDVALGVGGYPRGRII
jgi:recA bacterial DNA recombination protein